MPRVFTRQLGQQPGIQLNPIKDSSGGGVLLNFDSTAALIGRFTRGRIDKPFLVNRNTMKRMLGKPASIGIPTTGTLNEAWVHAYEALTNGASAIVAQRLTPAAAAISWVTFTSLATSTFAVEATEPSGTSHTFSVKHLGCHNDGIKVRVHADTFLVSGTPTANPVVTVIILSADDEELYRFTGSLTQGAVDGAGESFYLPDVAALVTDELVWNIPTGATIATTHDGYGKDAGGNDKWATSGASALVAFAEGGTSYATTDYDRVVQAVKDSPFDFGYIMGGGTRATALITRLADLAYDTNRQFIFDVPGDLTVSAAITWIQGLGFGTTGKDHYPQAYYFPAKSLDPVNNNLVFLGTSGIQVGLRCARNSVTNAYGLPEKNRAIAGINGVLGRRRVQPNVNLSEQNLSDLAAAKINPVSFQTFADGVGRWVFADVLTCAATSTSYRKLVTVAEMSSHLSELVARYARQVLLMPAEESIQRLREFLERTFEGAFASRWLVESDDPAVQPFVFTVDRNINQPVDRIDINFWLHFDGVARQVHIQQEIVG